MSKIFSLICGDAGILCAVLAWLFGADPIWIVFGLLSVLLSASGVVAALRVWRGDLDEAKNPPRLGYKLPVYMMLGAESLEDRGWYWEPTDVDYDVILDEHGAHLMADKPSSKKSKFWRHDLMTGDCRHVTVFWNCQSMRRLATNHGVLLFEDREDRVEAIYKMAENDPMLLHHYKSRLRFIKDEIVAALMITHPAPDELKAEIIARREQIRIDEDNAERERVERGQSLSAAWGEIRGDSR